MDKVTLAKTIAAKIDSHTQNEIDAMISIVCELHDVAPNELYKLVGHVYHEANRSEMVAANRGYAMNGYCEIEPR